MIDEKKYAEMVAVISKSMVCGGLPPESEPVRLFEASLNFSPEQKLAVANSIWIMLDAMVELQVFLGAVEESRAGFEHWRDDLWQLIKNETV
jgi:hypothetical protein